MRRWILAAAAIFLICGLTSTTSAQFEPDCSTPRSAVRTWVDNIYQDDPAERHPELAIQCFDWAGAGVLDRTQQKRLARRLIQVLNVRGHIVEAREVPPISTAGSDALKEYYAEWESMRRIPVFPSCDTGVSPCGRSPELTLEKSGDRWLISEQTIEQIPALYDEAGLGFTESIRDRMPAWLNNGIGGFQWWQGILVIIILALGILIRWIVSVIIRSQGVRLLRRVGHVIEPKVMRDAAKPIGTLAMAGLIWYTLPWIHFGVHTNAVILIALRVVAAGSLIMVIYRLVDVGAALWSKRAEETDTKLDDQLIPLIRKAAKVIVTVLGIIFVLQNLDVDITSLLAGVGVGGVALAFAAQDTVANVFGSVSIFADGPFQIGDWVVIDGVEGTVIEVGMRSSRLRTFYNSVITMPNSKIANSVVDNFSRREKRRTVITLGVTYDSTPEQIEGFCEGIRAILKANPMVEKNAYEVHFKGFGDFALEIMVYFFLDVKTWTDELRSRHNIYLEILRLSKKLGLSFAFPTQSLHIETMAGPAKSTPASRPSTDVMAQAIRGFGPGGELSKAQGFQLTDGYYAAMSRPSGSDVEQPNPDPGDR